MPTMRMPESRTSLRLGTSREADGSTTCSGPSPERRVAASIELLWTGIRIRNAHMLLTRAQYPVVTTYAMGSTPYG